MAGTVVTPSPPLNGAGGDPRAHAATRLGYSTAGDAPRSVAVIPRESGYRDGQAEGLRRQRAGGIPGRGMGVEWKGG